MLIRWKAVLLTGMFLFGAVCFVLGLLPALADVFWLVWVAGCVSCIVGLILAVTIPVREPEDAATDPRPS
ncbi:hypothetical protein [Brevibacterium sp.]|uniref:hypothetical protein n=1 Tax=Brevibacterium sp. TaxID=1701 RepID=UPI0028127315|nr:hypothetical protein [Brevibacterium sp.]